MTPNGFTLGVYNGKDGNDALPDPIITPRGIHQAEQMVSSPPIPATEEDVQAIIDGYTCGRGDNCGKTGPNGWTTIHAPCHDDINPSAGVKLDENSRLAVNCFACPWEKTVAALRQAELWPEKSTPSKVFDPIDPDDPWGFWEKRGIPQEFVESLGVNWVQLGEGAFRFPFDGLTVYKVRDLEGKRFWHPKGGPNPPLWPIPISAPKGGSKKIIICAGEPDCVALRYAGFDNAYAVTKGEGTVPWLAVFQELVRLGYEKITFLYDLDSAGVRGSQAAAEVAARAGLDARIATLPPSLALRGRKDVCDVLVAEDRDKTRLHNLVVGVLAQAKSRPETLSERAFQVRLPEANAADLQRSGSETTIETLPLLNQPNFVMKGWSHILGSYSKVGKTELMLRAAAGWPEEKVAYFTEEPETVWQARMSKAKGDYNNVTLIFVLGAPADTIIERMRSGDETVVILDTIRNLLGFESENDNAEISAALKPFVALAQQKGQTLIFLHHERKAGGEHGKALAGAGAFLGVVDVYLELGRDSNAARRRTLKGLARVIEVPEIMYELQDDGTMKAIGAPQEVTLTTVKGRIRQACVRWGTPRTLKEVVVLIGDPQPSWPQLRKALLELTAEATLSRDPPLGEKAKGKTPRWQPQKAKDMVPLV